MKPRGLAAVLMVLSGFAGLGYQLVWTQRAALLLGHEAAAVLAVVTAFFGGLALGGWSLGWRIEVSASPRRWYVLAELAMAGWGLLLLVLWRPLGELALSLTGVESGAAWRWTVAFAATFLLLLPATAAMGATLPAMERLLAARGEPRSLSLLYTCNTCGAVAGVLVTAGWSLAALGLSRTVWLCAGANLLCAALAWRAFPKSAPVVLPAPPLPLCRELVLGWRLAATGLLGIGYEVVVVRVLSQVTEDTVYTFAALLSVYLVGTAAGAAMYRRWLEPRAEGVGDGLFAALSVACLLGSLTLWQAEALAEWARTWLSGAWASAVVAEGLLALAAFALPTLAMGAVFSHLTRRAHADGVSFGSALGLNTAACATAPVLFGVLVLPSLGPKLTLLLIATGYLLLSSRWIWSKASFFVPAVGVLLVAWLAPPLRFVDVPEGGHTPRASWPRSAWWKTRAVSRGCGSTTASRRGAARRCASMPGKRGCRCCSTLRRSRPCF